MKSLKFIDDQKGEIDLERFDGYAKELMDSVKFNEDNLELIEGAKSYNVYLYYKCTNGIKRWNIVTLLDEHDNVLEQIEHADLVLTEWIDYGLAFIGNMLAKLDPFISQYRTLELDNRFYNFKNPKLNQIAKDFDLAKGQLPDNLNTLADIEQAFNILNSYQLFEHEELY